MRFWRKGWRNGQYAEHDGTSGSRKPTSQGALPAARIVPKNFQDPRQRRRLGPAKKVRFFGTKRRGWRAIGSNAKNPSAGAFVTCRLITQKIRLNSIPNDPEFATSVWGQPDLCELTLSALTKRRRALTLKMSDHKTPAEETGSRFSAELAPKAQPPRKRSGPRTARG